MARAVAAVKKLAEAEKCLIVGSLAGNTVSEMVEVASRFVDAGADLLEINLACPVTGSYLGTDYEKLGKYWCQAPGIAAEAINAVKARGECPRMGEMRSQRDRSGGIFEKGGRRGQARRLLFCGRKASLSRDRCEYRQAEIFGRHPAPDDEGNPHLPHGDRAREIEHDPPYRLSGQINFHAAHSVRRILQGEDVIEAMMVGAPSVQICTEVYRNPEASTAFLKEIEAFMNRKKIDSLAGIFGAALQYVPAPPLLKVPIFL